MCTAYYLWHNVYFFTEIVELQSVGAHKGKCMKKHEEV